VDHACPDHSRDVDVDGRAKDLEQQAGGPIVNPVEMASPEPHVAEQLKGIPGYRDAFAKAFPGEPDPITLSNVRRRSPYSRLR
jgi:cytochrome c peroxidase